MGLNYQAAGYQTEMWKGGKLPMAESIFMRVSEVAEELGVSQSYAYKLVRQLNKELAETGVPRRSQAGTGESQSLPRPDSPYGADRIQAHQAA